MPPITALLHLKAAALAIALAGATAWAMAQTQPVTTPATTQITAPAPALDTLPAWKDLSPAQQAALAPLAAQWPNISTARKNKWLEVSRNYANLPAPEQAKLHTRMADWTALSPQQRASARHNFARNQALTSGLTPEQRNAQWQAYQMLSPEEKSQLAASSPKPLAGPAAVVRPADPLKNSPPPKFGTAKALAKQSEPDIAPVSKISIAPHLQKSNSLMPQKSNITIAPAAGTETRQ